AGRADELLERWLKAQNDGDFSAYQALYAPEFQGIRRSGPRVARFDRAAWLKDRERMFKQRMVINADHVRWATSRDQARGIFDQTFRSGRYQDRGKKELVLVERAGALAIVREEMLTSQIGAADAARFGEFAYVVDGHLVLPVDPQEEWADAPLRTKTGENDV